MGKRLYAILWIDDVGSMPLSPKDVEWYHQNAGPISLALERDDRFPKSFEKVLGSPALSLSSDYLSHHYHPIRWKGLSYPKRIYDYLQLHWRFRSILRFTRMEALPKRLFRLVWSLALVALGLLIYYLYYLSPPAFFGLGVLFLLLIGLVGVWFYVQYPGNWQDFFPDKMGHRSLLLRIKDDFKVWGQEYPAVVRHGWNLPPPSMMEFYLSELHVLADASATPTTYEGSPSIGNQAITWKVKAPYYASRQGGYNVPWKGDDEEDRGILELPVTLGNIAAYGFGSAEKQVIRDTPEHGLVSVYIHPWDSFSVVKKWVDFLKTNYDVQFARADEYAHIFMRKYPRPILIDKELKANWAFRDKGRLQAIRQVDAETFYLRADGGEEGWFSIEMRVNTGSPILEIGFELAEVKVVEGGMKLEQDGRLWLARQVGMGYYQLQVRV